MLWTYLVPSEFCIFICKHDNFNVLNKLPQKYQNTSEIVNDFIVENNQHFLKLKEYFKRNAQVYQYHTYATFFLKSFCRVDDYGVKIKVAFDIAYRSYKNKQEKIHFIREMLIKQEVLETSEVVESCHQLLRHLLLLLRVKKKKECKPPQKRKAKCQCEIVAKIAMKTKKRDEKKAILLSELETNDLHIKRTNSNVCKK